MTKDYTVCGKTSALWGNLPKNPMGILLGELSLPVNTYTTILNPKINKSCKVKGVKEGNGDFISVLAEK